MLHLMVILGLKKIQRSGSRVVLSLHLTPMTPPVWLGVGVSAR